MAGGFTLLHDTRFIKEGMDIETVYDFLLSQNIAVHWVNEESLVLETCCHNHKGEGSHKLYYYDKTKLFNCYTECGYFDIFDLVNKTRVLEGQDELLLEDIANSFIQKEKFVLVNKESTLQEEEEREYRPPVLNVFKMADFFRFPFAYSKDWAQEGISYKTQMRYKTRFNWFDNAIMFPHFDEFWNLIGMRQRLLSDESAEIYGKYRPVKVADIIYSNPTSFYLFGLNYTGRNIRMKRKAVIFESEKSVMLLEEGIGLDKNISCASLGMHFSMHQFKLLESMGVEEIIFAYDRQFQEAGDSEYEGLIRLYTGFAERFFKESSIKGSYIFDAEKVTGYKDSPIDCGMEKFIKLYNDRKNILDLLEEETIEISVN